MTVKRGEGTQLYTLTLSFDNVDFVVAVSRSREGEEGGKDAVDTGGGEGDGGK